MTVATLEDLVRARLDAKGWTRAELAAKAKISEAGLRKLCRGLVADARGRTVNRLASALGITPEAVRAALAESAGEAVEPCVRRRS